jgi:hypothetical protein
MKCDVTRAAAEDIIDIKTVDSEDVDVIMERTGLSRKRVRLLLSVMKGGRIDYSVFDKKLSSGQSKCETKAETGVRGCVAEILDMIEESIGERDREIFTTWVGLIHKNNKTRLTANAVGGSVEEVLTSVRNTKRTLRKLVKQGITTNA